MKNFTRSLRPSDSHPPVSPPFWRHIGESDFFIFANSISRDHISDLWPASQSVHIQGLCKNGTVEMCSFPELFFSEVHLDDQITQTHHRSTPYPSPMCIWRHIGGHMHLLHNFAPPPSSLPGTLPQITQPGCEASSLSPVLGKHRTPPPISDSDWLSTFSGEV